MTVTTQITIPTFLASILLLVTLYDTSLSLENRQEFSIPLVKIAVANDESTGKYIRAKITHPNENEQAIITVGDDTYIKNTSRGSEKSLFRESASRSFMLSSFEVEEMRIICKGFIQTLEIFERDLKDEKFDRIRYLDGYFPKFLKNFKILLFLAKADDDFGQIQRLIPDSKFDVSLNSPKTDQRVQTWKSQKDYIMKLRIVTKELAYQLKTWESKDLSSRGEVDIMKSANVEQFLDLFIKVYFNSPADIQNLKERD